MGGEREVKECPICLDGVEYPKNVGNVRSVKLLRMKTKSANTTVNDDFADVFDNTFMKKRSPHP